VNLEPRLAALPAETFAAALEQAKNRNPTRGSTMRACELVITAGIYRGPLRTLTGNVSNRRHRQQHRRSQAVK